MKQSKIYRKLLSVALAAVMVLSLTNGMSVGKARAAEEGLNGSYGWEQTENNGKGLMAGNKRAQAEFEENYVQDGKVRVSIVLKGESTLKKFPVKGIATNTAAKKYRDGILSQQEEMAATISRKVLNGEELDVVWNITLAANIISAYVPYDKVEQIRHLVGVKDVVYETIYEAAVASKDETDPDMSTASEMVGSNYAWAAGYTGAGSKIAIVDTGLDKEHQSFAADAFDESIKNLNVDLLTADEVAAAYDMLNAKRFISSAEGMYYSSKVPYGVNYVDRSLDFTHINDKQGEHGSHVAGIAAANRLVSDGNGGFVEALDTVKTQGEAPDAQLLIMKVFGNRGSGASDSDYMVAIEDAIILGADSVNLSLGSGNPGAPYNSTYETILNEVADAINLVWCNSAGNSYSWADYSSQGYLYDEDVSFATGGSPGTYAPTFSVASVNNKGTTAYSFEAAGVKTYYNETSGYGNEPLTSIAGEHEYVLLDGPGVDDNEHVGQAGDAFMALGKEVVEGKVAFCYRGDSSFFAKANAAAAQGAKAVVIINNQAGVINMNLSGYLYTVPAVSILQADGNAIKAGSKKETDANGNVYYTGTITISDTIGVDNPGDDFVFTMSDFSSWGVPGDLSMKPEITAPGGNIYSIFGYSRDTNGNIQGGHNTYENMSGTSMASPQVAGLTAVLAQYIRENNLTEKTGRTQRQLVLSLLMSTAEPMVDAWDEYFPVIQQGSGLANVNNAINAKSYITIDGVAATAPRSALHSINEGKVKVELGEVKGDSFETTFTLHNFTDEKVEYALNADFFTQLIYPVYISSGYTDEYRTGYLDYLDLAYEWTVNGEPYEPASVLYDFNGDHVANGQDALHLLNYCAGLVEDNKLFNANIADLDKDGDIDTYDARLAFELLNGASVAVDAKDVTVTLKVSGLSDAIKTINGNYIEGYIFAKESDSEDGAIGVTHSIPVLGFYGNWTDGSMYDKGDVLSFYYGYADKLPYLYGVTGGFSGNTYSQTGYTINGYSFLGNPFANDVSMEDEEATPLYLPERNAVSEGSTVNSFAYTPIRNSAASRFYLEDSAGNIVYSVQMGNTNAAYYYVNGSSWQGRVSTKRLNYVLRGVTEDEQYFLKYQAAPEYYVNADGTVRWDDLGAGSTYSLPIAIDNTAPTVAVKSLEDGKLVLTAQDNRWVAAVALFTEDGTLVDYYGGFAELEKGEAYDYEFDLSELEETHYLVEVYDYAENLNSWKLNLNPEEEDDPVTVKIDQSEYDAVIINGGALQLTATVYPWGFVENDAVTWASADETIATVNENGLVTSVATEDSSVVITATSVQDPSASASITVKIVFIRKNMNGFVWDENGAVWASRFDISRLPRYTKLNREDLGIPIAAAAYDEKGTLYASSLSKWNGTETLYTVNTSTWELTEVGAMDLAFVDFCQAPSLGGDYLLAAYAYYVAVVDKATGEYLGVVNFSSITGDGWFTGIAYMMTDEGIDYILLVDDYGTLYIAYFYLDEDGEISLYTPRALGTIGEAVDLPYWQSLYFDGTYVYWSRFCEAENDVDLIMCDLMKTGNIFNIGSFADSVWPVGGLFELGVNPSANSAGDLPFDVELVPSELTFEKGEIEKVEGKATAATKNPAGSLNAVKDGGETVEPDKISTEVTVELAAEELTKNGYFCIEYPETVELVSYSSPAQYKAWNEKEEGKLILAFVDLEGIETDGTLLKLVFSKNSQGTVTITTTDINEDDEKELVETVVLGVAGHNIHTYGEPVWTWAEDYKSATATFTCELGDDTQVIDAVVTYEDDEETKTRTYTATVEFEGKTYTDTKTVENFWEPFEWTRLGGKSRYDTMGLIVDEGFKEDHSAKTILVSIGGDYKTALLASGLAGALDAPLLTVPKTASNAEYMAPALAEIERLAAADCEVLLLGPATEADDTVLAAIKEKVANVRRVEADSAPALASKLYEEGAGKWNTTGTVILATGNAYADTLSISPYAYAAKTPIFYTTPEKTLRAEDMAFMKSDAVKRVIIAGGKGAVSLDIENELKDAGLEVLRLSGSNRYLTSAAIVKWALGMNTEALFQPEVLLGVDKMGVATGSNFADALASVDLLGRTKGVLLLVSISNTDNQAAFETNVAEIIVPNKKQMTAGYIFGGKGAVNLDIEAALNAAVAED